MTQRDICVVTNRSRRIPGGRTVTLSCVIALLIFSAVSEAQVTVPGFPNIEPTRIRYGVMEYDLSLVRGDETESIGVIRDEIMPIRGNDPVLRRVLVLTRGSTVLIDSTYTDLETLAPRWHKSVQPQRTFDFEMDGTRVRGMVAPKGSDPRKIDTTIASLAFDSSNWDLIIRSLPLEEGDAAVLSVYDVDNNLQRYSIRVVDKQPRGTTDVIHVQVDMGPGKVAHAWFDDTTRVLLRLETQLSPDVLLKQVLRR